LTKAFKSLIFDSFKSFKKIEGQSGSYMLQAKEQYQENIVNVCISVLKGAILRIHLESDHG